MPIDKKIIEVMRAVRGVARDSRNNFDAYDYASHEAVTAALRGHFAAHGIVRSVNMVALEVLPGDAIHVTVDVTYTDSEDDTHVTCRMHALQPPRKVGAGVNAQQVGQALSYAVKNVEFKLFCLTGDVEQDADARSQTARAATPEELRARAQELLQLVGRATTREELDSALGEARDEWGELQSVPQFGESMRAMREGALAKLGAP